MNCRLGPYFSGIDCVTRTVDDEFVDAVLYVMGAIRGFDRKAAAKVE